MAKDTKEIEKKVIEILADKLDIDSKKVKPESRLVEDLGIDSFGAIEIMFEIEDKLKIEIPEEIVRNLKTVSEICNYIKTKKYE